MTGLNIGCHLSVAGGYLHMGQEALSIHANTFQFFTRNPRGGKSKEIVPADIDGLRAFLQEKSFAPIVAHAPYTLNACSADPRVREFALMVMADDLKILAHLPGTLYNFHPGSHVGQGIEVGIGLIADVLNQTLTPDLTSTVLLETMSGKGSEIGSDFQELREIIDRVDLGARLGVCMDSCHVYSAGYDIVNDLDGVLTQFDRIVGLDRLKAFHLNDSKMPFNSRKDRHEKIGQGTIGTEAIIRIINHPALKHLPFNLETPNELPGYADEIRMLQEAFLG